MYARNAGMSNTTTRTNASGAGENSRSTSLPLRIRVATIWCPKHGLAHREAGDQCAECNRDRAKENEVRNERAKV